MKEIEVELINNLYFNQKMKLTDISKNVGKSISTISRVIRKDSRYMEEKDNRKKENKEKHIRDTKNYMKNKRKIEQFIGKQDDLILKNLHNQASLELSFRKSLNNNALRKWCDSYKFNKKKRKYEFDDSSVIRPIDFPKYINA